MGVKKYFYKKYIFISKIKTINLKKGNQIDGFLIVSIKLSWILIISKKSTSYPLPLFSTFIFLGYHNMSYLRIFYHFLLDKLKLLLDF
ncbi:hypothetical protein ACUXG3_002754 [Bacillus thuringiensis]|nr:transposase OrfB [Bacillus cereus]